MRSFPSGFSEATPWAVIGTHASRAFRRSSPRRPQGAESVLPCVLVAAASGLWPINPDRCSLPARGALGEHDRALRPKWAIAHLHPRCAQAAPPPGLAVLHTPRPRRVAGPDVRPRSDHFIAARPGCVARSRAALHPPSATPPGRPTGRSTPGPTPTCAALARAHFATDSLGRPPAPGPLESAHGALRTLSADDPHRGPLPSPGLRGVAVARLRLRNGRQRERPPPSTPQVRARAPRTVPGTGATAARVPRERFPPPGPRPPRPGGHRTRWRG